MTDWYENKMNPLADAAADACGGPTPMQSLARGVEADALEYLQERWELPSHPQVCCAFTFSLLLQFVLRVVMMCFFLGGGIV